MEIKTFESFYLHGTKDALKSAFYHENSDEFFNEWEFAEICCESFSRFVADWLIRG